MAVFIEDVKKYSYYTKNLKNPIFLNSFKIVTCKTLWISKEYIFIQSLDFLEIKGGGI